MKVLIVYGSETGNTESLAEALGEQIQAAGHEVKVLNAVGAIALRMADETAIRAVGGEPGFMSPIGVKKGTKIVVDVTVMEMVNVLKKINHNFFNILYSFHLSIVSETGNIGIGTGLCCPDQNTVFQSLDDLASAKS